jgi:hypothetical protein
LLGDAGVHGGVRDAYRLDLLVGHGHRRGQHRPDPQTANQQHRFQPPHARARPGECERNGRCGRECALQQLPASRVGPIVSSVGAVLPVVLLGLLSPRRVSLSLDAATLLAVGLVLTGVGAYRLAATAGRGPLAAT